MKCLDGNNVNFLSSPRCYKQVTKKEKKTFNLDLQGEFQLTE